MRLPMMERSSRWLQTVPLYPVAIAAAYVLDLAAAHAVEPAGFARPVLVAMVGAAVIVAAATLAARSATRGGLIALAALLLLATYQPLVVLLSLLVRWFGLPGAVYVLALLAFLTLALIATAILQFRRRPVSLPRLTAGLNAVTLVLLVLVVVRAAGESYLPGSSAVTETGQRGVARGGQPDIYLILLDGYPRADVLADVYDVDGSALVDTLHARGFTVSPHSHSNYTYTELTLTSLLLGDYLASGSDRPSSISQREMRLTLVETAHQGAVPRALRSAGYRLVATAPGWEHVSLRGTVDAYLDRPELTDLETALLRRTWIPEIPLVPHDWFIAQQRSRIDGIFADALQLATEPREGPIFALIHVPSPHMPIVFGADGGPVPWGSRQLGAATPRQYGLSTAEFQHAYALQLEHLNTALLGLTDAIAGAQRPAITMVFSDHGSSPNDEPDLRSLLPNLVAVRDIGGAVPMSQLSSPLNALRGILDRHAGSAWPSLPDRFWIAWEEDGILQLREATPLQ